LISWRVHKLVVNPVRLPSITYYSGRIATYKFDRTIVTVGAPRMLAMSTSPASADASSCASAAAASSATAAVGVVPSSATGGWPDNCAKSSSMVGAGLRLAPAGSPTVSQPHSSPYSTGSVKDRYGKPEKRGSEWEPIKILLEGDGNSNKMNTASNTRLRLTTKVGQAHVATGVPLDLGTNTQPSDPRTQRKNQTSSLQTHTGQSGEHHRSDRSLLVKLSNFH
jgi:hypothetical protein